MEVTPCSVMILNSSSKTDSSLTWETRKGLTGIPAAQGHVSIRFHSAGSGAGKQDQRIIGRVYQVLHSVVEVVYG